MLQTLKYILIPGTTKQVSTEYTERLFTNRKVGIPAFCILAKLY